MRALLPALLLLPLAAAQGGVSFGPEEQGYPTGFAPSRVEAAPGAEVTFRNTGQFAHTVTFDGGGFDSGLVDPGGAATFRAPETPGEYRFVCTYHEETGMVGTLVVAAASGPAPASDPTPAGVPTPSAPASPALSTPGGPTPTPTAGSSSAMPGPGVAPVAAALGAAALLAARRR